MRAISISEQLCRTLFEHMPQGFAYCELVYDDAGVAIDFRYLSVNESFVRLTGLQDVEGRLISEVIPGSRSTDPEWLATYTRVVSTGESVTFQAPVTDLGLRLSVVAHRPEPDCFVAVFTDVSEDERVASALRAENALLQHVLDSLPLSVGIIDARGNVLQLNAMTAQIWGDAPLLGAIEAYDRYKAWWPQTGQRLGSEDWTTARAIAAGHALTDEEIEIERFDGLHRVLRSSTVPLLSADGAITGWVGMAEDITERARAAADLRVMQHRLALAERIAELGHWVWTPAEDRLEWPEEMYVIFGVDPSTFVPTMDAMNALIHPDDVALRMQAVNDVLHGKPTREYRYRIPQRTGERVIHAKSMDAMRDRSGAIVGVFGTSLDVTEHARIQAELVQLNDELEERVEGRTAELEAALDARGRFLAAMSHELRTPLNSIIGFSGVLGQGLTGTLNVEQQRQISIINDSGKHLLELVDEVLDLAKVRSEHLPLRMAVFSVDELVEHVLTIIRPAAELKGLRLEVFGTVEADTMRSDRARMSQVLVNLMGNAVKYTEHGSVTLRVVRSASELVFEVIDTGPGIDAEAIPRVFDDFYQGTQRGMAKSAGVGLGLSLSRHIAEALSGSLAVTCGEGEGCTFTLRVPIDSA